MEEGTTQNTEKAIFQEACRKITVGPKPKRKLLPGDDDDWNILKAQSNFYYIFRELTGNELKKCGTIYDKAECPFCQDKSFTYTHAKNIFYCFGCHKSGDVFNLVAELRGLSLIHTFKYLDQIYNSTDGVSISTHTVEGTRRLSIDIPSKLHAKFKSACIIHTTSIKDVIVEFISEYTSCITEKTYENE